MFFKMLFLCSKTSPYLLNMFMRMLQHCFAVKLKKMFCGWQTSLDFHHTMVRQLNFQFLVNLFPKAIMRHNQLWC